MKKKTFLFCLGSPKSGTTWLYKNLRSNWFADFGFTKEYTLFSYLFRGEERPLLLENYRLAQEFYDDPDKYFEFFSNLDSALVGDLDPAYISLDANAFEYMKRNLEEHNFKVKVIILMRDPFERIWSSYNSISLDCLPKKVSDIFPKLSLSDYSKLDYTSSRTRYERGILEAEKVFSDIHYEFYENLFNETSYKKITDFLDVPLRFNSPNFDRVNKTDYKNERPSAEIENEIKEFYKSTYDYIFERFPEVKQYWQYK